MLLSADEIREAVESGTLFIDLYADSNLQPASLDLTLDPTLWLQSAEPITGIKLNPETLNVQELLKNYSTEVQITEVKSLDLGPRQFVIGTTAETVGLPLNLAGRGEARPPTASPPAAI